MIGESPIKMYCLNLAADALHKAIEDYLKRRERRLRLSKGLVYERLNPFTKLHQLTIRSHSYHTPEKLDE